jgi:hypothetical protein
MTHCNEMIYQQVTLSGYAEWPKVADAVIEANGLKRKYQTRVGGTQRAGMCQVGYIYLAFF